MGMSEEGWIYCFQRHYTVRVKHHVPDASVSLQPCRPHTMVEMVFWSSGLEQTLKG